MRRLSIFVIVGIPCALGYTNAAAQVCDIAGRWSNQATVTTTWIFKGSGPTYDADETGGCGAEGTATLSGRTITVNWSCPKAGYLGVYTWTLNADCTAGKGQVRHLGPKMKGHTKASTIEKIGGPAKPSPAQVARCDIAARQAELSALIDRVVALGERMKAYIQRPLVEPFTPQLPEMCIQDDTATLKFGGFWRSVSDKAAELNGYLGFFTGASEALGFNEPTPEEAKEAAKAVLEGAEAVKTSAEVAARGANFVVGLTDMARQEILKRKQRTMPYEQGLAEYKRLRKMQKDTEAFRASLRRRHICAVKIGVPSFYRSFHALQQTVRKLENDARSCGETVNLGRGWARLHWLYDWHNHGVFCDVRTATCGQPGFEARHSWIEKNVGIGRQKRPPILNSVTCQ